jgi:hypothetical protein
MRSLPWTFWASLWVLSALSILWGLRATTLYVVAETFEVPPVAPRTLVQGSGTLFYLVADDGSFVPVTQEAATRFLVREATGTPIELLNEALPLMDVPTTPSQVTIAEVLQGGRILRGRNGPISVLPERPVAQPIPEAGAVSEKVETVPIQEPEPVRGTMPIVLPDEPVAPAASNMDTEGWINYAPF